MFSSGMRRRRPWPYDAIINGTGVMLWQAPKAGGSYRQTPVGELSASHPTPLANTQPSDLKPSSQNPNINTEFSWNDFSLGMGLRQQVGENDRRYRFANQADCSIQGQVIWGPQITQVTPSTVDATNGVVKFFEIDGSLYALNGRYVQVRAEVQTVTEAGTPTGGTFTLTYAGNTTSALAFDVSAANMQTALRLLTGLESVTVTRTGASNFVWTVVMRGAGTNPAQMTHDDALLTGGSGGAGGGGSITNATSATTDQAGGWTVDKDFGSGKAATDVIVFYTNAGSGANYAYIGMGDSELMYRFDGTTYTQHGSLFATAWCMQGRDLWRATGNTVAKVDVDAEPWTAGNWSATNAFTIGEKQSTITRMVLNAAGVLVIMKTDGIYTLDEIGEDHQLYPGMRFSSSNTENGKYPYLSENWIYVTYGGTHYRIDQSMTIEPIGPEQYADNDSQVKGYITAGVDTQFANYAGIYNPDNGHSYLLKFGAWINDEQGSSKRVDAWHGSLSAVTISGGDGINTETAAYASDKITAMWRSTVGADSNHERIYIGTLAGKISWFQLSCTPNPTNCSNYDYATGGGNSCNVFLPYWHGGFQDNKNIKAGIIQATSLSTNSGTNAGPAYFGYRTVGATAYVETSAFTSRPGGRQAINSVSALADFELRLQCGLSASGGAGAVITAVGIDYQTRPPIALIYKTFYVLAENGLRRGDGVPIRIGADQIKTLMKAACATAAGVTVITADESSQTLVLQDYTEDLVWDEDLKQYHAIVSFVGVTTDVSSTSVVGAQA